MGDLKTMQEATMMTTLFNVLATEWVTGPKGEMIEDDQTEKDKVIEWQRNKEAKEAERRKSDEEGRKEGEKMKKKERSG